MTKRQGKLNDFWDMFRESVIIQSVATIMLLGTCCAIYLVPVLRGQSAGEVPPLLAALTGTVMGYWFKAKAAYQASLPSAQSGSE